MNDVTVLIPTRDRAAALAVTLNAVGYQTYERFHVVISDQSEGGSGNASGCVAAARRLLEHRGRQVRHLRNLPARGMAQQRQFLLDHCDTRYCLFLDDDVILEPFVIGNLVRVLEEQQCGFAGNALIGLSYARDIRPHEQHIELWRGAVQPETILPHGPQWRRHVLHNAANILHVQEALQASPHAPLTYKVAWVGGCVMFDAEKLRACGGFDFWQELPRKHCGEDVLAQLRVARRFGGCGVLPSGAYHQELPTTIAERTINAPEYLTI